VLLIRMFTLLDPDPNPLVRGTDPDPSIIKQKNTGSKENLDSYYFATSLWLFILEKLCKCIFKK